jgi:transposase
MEKNKISYFKTAVIFGIPCDSVLQKWKRKYDEQGAIGFIQGNLCRKEKMSFKKSKLEEKTKEELLKELKELQCLQVENAYLKKLQALVQERITRENGKKPKPSKN